MTYCLDRDNKFGAPKARGFALILGITIEDIDYLAEAILSGILSNPMSAVRDRAPHGFNCVVEVPVRGIGRKKDRAVGVRTVWRVTKPDSPPRLATAFPRP
jgi:hypothetical protein